MYCSLCGTDMGDTGECPRCKAASPVIPPEPVITEHAPVAPELPPSTSGLANASLKIRLIVGIVLIVVIAASIIGYEYHSVPVTAGTIVQCSDSRHQGEKVLSKDVRNLSVHFFDKEKYEVETSFIVCDACRIRNEKEEEQANILRLQKEEADKIQSQEKQERSEAESIIRNIKLSEFIVINDRSTNWQDNKFSPGGPVRFIISIRNMNNMPISGLKFKIEPWGTVFSDEGPNHDSGSLATDEQNNNKLKSILARNFNSMETSGLPIVGKNNKSLLPYNSPVYTSEEWNNTFSGDDFKTLISIKKSCREGQVIPFKLYFLYRGQKIEAGSFNLSIVLKE